MQFLRHAHEIAQMPQLHSFSLRLNHAALHIGQETIRFAMQHLHRPRMFANRPISLQS
jgi:hypothetical protein